MSTYLLIFCLQNGQTALSIAQRLGYISVVETLKVVTEQEITTTTTTTIEEKYKVLAPESMQETFMSDSEDEGGKNQSFFGFSHTGPNHEFLSKNSVEFHFTKNEFEF